MRGHRRKHAPAASAAARGLCCGVGDRTAPLALRAGLLAALILGSVGALAQQAGPAQPVFSSSPSLASGPGAAVPAAALNPTIVTGTHVQDRTVLSSTAPVDVFSADDLRAAAGPEADLGQALQALLPSFNYLDQSNSGSADHVRAGQLHGLSPDQVLVLINGKRVHTTSIVNVESTEGQGAVAVDFAAIPVNAVRRVEVLRDGAGAQYGSDAIAGVINILLDDAPQNGGELGVSAGLFHTHFAPTDRTIDDGQTVNLQGKYGLALADAGYLHFGLDATSHEPTNRAGIDNLYDNFPAQTPVTFRAGDARIRNLKLWADSSVPLADGATGYSVLLFSRRNSAGDDFFRERNDPSNYSLYTNRDPNGFRPQSTGTNADWHISGGIRGPLQGSWKYDASLTFGYNAFVYGLDDSLNASLGPASPTRFDLGGFRFSQTTAQYDVTGPLDLGLAAPSTLAVGVELRRESYQDRAGDPASYQTGPFGLAPPQGLGNPAALAQGGAQGDAGLSPNGVSDSDRSASGIYADLSGQVVKNLFADAGARFDRYSDAGSAATGKLSARWEFVPNWSLRSSISNNFRAPALAQIATAYSPTLYANGAGQGTRSILPVSDPLARSLGAQTLRPERAKNLSVGLAAEPLRALQISADFFRIDIDDRIALSSPLSPTAGPGAGNSVQFFTNAVDTTTHGAELAAGWTGQVLGGALHLADASTWTTNALRGIHAQPPQVDALGAGLLFGVQEQNALTNALPRRRDIVTATWSDPRWNLLARGTHTGQVTRVFDFGSGDRPVQTYGATFQLDLEAEVHALRDLALALGVQNLTDRYPTPSNAATRRFGSNLPYDFLSPIGFDGRFLYLRVRYALH